jgi:hypothetical protein
MHYGAITTARHALGIPAKVSGGLGFDGTFGGFGCRMDGLNQKSRGCPQPSPGGTGGWPLHSGL